MGRILGRLQHIIYLMIRSVTYSRLQYWLKFIVNSKFLINSIDDVFNIVNIFFNFVLMDPR